ncbi:FtsQ-type POTRA domain-containing protein [Candidatus Woesebacteria bacterium]|nr:FtsQ-type POTRA domain-containing protein [Candidatus Woesebacteria bacterium]
MRRLAPYILISIALLLCGMTYFLFRIAHINVSGSKQLSGIDKYSSNFIFLLKPIEVEKEILQQNPTLEKVVVELIYPNTLSILAIEARPIAKIVLEDGYMAISSEGKILAKQRDDMSTLPIGINYYQPLYFRSFAVGDVIDINEMIDAVFFIEELQKLALPVGNVDIRNENMIVLFLEDYEILVSSTKDTLEQMAQLKVVLEQFRTKAVEFSRLDVRFEKPIVVFKK